MQPLKTEILAPHVYPMVDGFSKSPVHTRRSNAFDLERLSPKRAKRIISNREAAHRSRQKKLERVHQLRDQVQWLTQERTYLLHELNNMQIRQQATLEEQMQLEWQFEQLKHDEEREKARQTYLKIQNACFDM